MNNGTVDSSQKCAHIHVERFTVEKAGRVFEEQWRCGECGTTFVALDSLFSGPQEIKIMEPVKTLRDEFAMAALPVIIYLRANSTAMTYDESVETTAYLYADEMLRARK